MKSMYFTTFLICCLLVYLSAVANTVSEDIEKPPASNESVDSMDKDYGTINLSELSDVEKQYFGLRDDVKPILQNVDVDLIIVEFMSIYCPNCRVQALVLNKLYSTIEKDPELQSRAKILTIGAGNNVREIEKFRADVKALFPILIDPKFAVYDRLAHSMRSPYTVMLRKDKEGNLIMVDAHRGPIRSYRAYLDKMKIAMQYDEEILKLKQEEKLAGNVAEKSALKLSEEELTAKVQEILIKASGDENISIVAKQVVPKRRKPKSYEKIYVGNSGDTKYTAVVVNEEPVCDMCHVMQFIYIFNELGKVISFEPIYLTKGGNAEWDDEDIKKMRDRVFERSIFQLMSFDSEVDAVSSATITSAMIFKAIAQGKDIYSFIK